jgi:hypothetical protein
VPVADARLMLGQNAIDTFHRDGAALHATVEEIGTEMS